MAGSDLARFTLHPGGADGAPDPLTHPEWYGGVAVKRVLAYFVDVVCIAALMALAAVVFALAGILTLGLLNPLLMALFALIPVTYHTVLIGGPRSATWGMRLFGLEVRALSGARPDYVQALIQTVLFYISVGLTSWLVLIVALFNGRRRTLHDFIAGTVVVNRRAATAGWPGAAPRAGAV